MGHALILVALVSLLACSRQAGTPTPDQVGTLVRVIEETPTPNSPIFARFSTRWVQRVWFYRPPHDGNLDLLARNFDNYILTQPDADARDELKRLGVRAPFLEYLSFGAIDNPGSCTAEPFHNQVADRPGDFCVLSQQHPDWFLRDSDGSLIPEDEGDRRYVLMDLANPGWQSFWLERARAAMEQSGWDGIFLDNVEASLTKRHKVGKLPAKYPDDARYRAAVQDFLNLLYNRYFRPQGRPLMANIIELGERETWFEYLQYLDGAMQENFAIDWSGRFKAPAEWEQDLKRAEMTQALGKRVLLVSQGPKNDLLRQQFALASYLLVAYGNAAFRYSNSDSYEEAWTYDSDGLDLGAPTATRYKVGNAWKRDFEKGIVTVDPTTFTASIARR